MAVGSSFRGGSEGFPVLATDLAKNQVEEAVELSPIQGLGGTTCKEDPL
jgi:hypothetical protein